MLLSLLVFLPTIGAAAVLLAPKELAKRISMSATVAAFVLSLFLIPQFLGDDAFGKSFQDASAFKWSEQVPWIEGENFTINYAIGVDGLSFPLILLTTLISLLGTIRAHSPPEKTRRGSPEDRGRRHSSHPPSSENVA